MKRFYLVGLFVAMSAIGGCASWAPVPVVHPVVTTTGYAIPKSAAPVTPTKMQELIALVRAYANTWAARRDELSFELNQANNGVFVGGITAALAGLRQSVEGTRIGALIGGGSALFADHFKIATQRDNYRQGAQLMGCIEDELASIPSTLWDEYFTGDGAYKGQTGNDGYKSIATIRDTTIATMNKVIRKLGDSQGVIAFSTPDQATLKEAFAKYAEAKTNAGTNAKTIALALQKSENGKEQIINEYELAKLIALPAGIKTCMPAS